MINDSTEQTIDELKSLKLKDYPINDIYRLIYNLGEFGTIIAYYNPGKVIMRARPIYGNEKFAKVSDFSFKPKELNVGYQRASIPGRTMFYGCTISDKEEDKDLTLNRVIGLFESIAWLRDKSKKGVQKLAYGRWIVKKSLKLIAIVFKEDFYNATSYSRVLVDGFKEFIRKNPDLEAKTLLISSFLANEFGKKEIIDDSDYLISAIFTDVIISKGFDGILYPSVQMEGKGFNVALTPNAVIQKLKFEVAGECIVYKNYERLTMDNLTIAVVDDGKEEFILREVEPQFHAGESACLYSIGVSSLEQL